MLYPPVQKRTPIFICMDVFYSIDVTPDETTRTWSVLLPGACARASHARPCCLPCQDFGPTVCWSSSQPSLTAPLPVLPSGGRHLLNITSRLPRVGTKRRTERATEPAIVSPPASTKASDISQVKPMEGRHRGLYVNIHRGERQDRLATAAPGTGTDASRDVSVPLHKWVSIAAPPS